jgi:hypothetical protein
MARGVAMKVSEMIREGVLGPAPKRGPRLEHKHLVEIDRGMKDLGWKSNMGNPNWKNLLQRFLDTAAKKGRDVATKQFFKSYTPTQQKQITDIIYKAVGEK